MQHSKVAVLLASVYFLIGNGEATATSRIVHGEPVDIEDYPYMVSLRRNSFHFCGGAVIGKRQVLTAAHCIIGKSKTFTAHTGTSLVWSMGQVHRVAGYKIHPGYNGTEAASWVNDIAVITLKDPIAFDKTQQPVELPKNDVEDGTAANITGWGRVSMSGSPSRLQKLETTLITAGRCQALEKNKIYDTQVCAFKSEETGACFGDSGSPLVVDGTVVGVASWIEGNYCAAGYPDVYTKVYDYLDFVQSVMKKN